MSASQKKVLGIDPGTGRLGWSIVIGNRQQQQLLDWGCLETKANSEQSYRLHHLFTNLQKIIDHYNPDEVAMEDLFFFKNAKTVIKVAEARGMVITCANINNLSVTNYTPLQIKQTITGYGRADKKQVQDMVKTTLKQKEIIKPDDAADAVAVALTHLFSAKFLK